MNREQASKGYVVNKATTITAAFYGFTITSAAVVTSIGAPTVLGPEQTAYNGDETGLATLTTLPAGYYPIRGSSLVLASGEAILWLE